MKIKAITASAMGLALVVGTGAVVAHAEAPASAPAFTSYTPAMAFGQDRDDRHFDRDGQWDAPPQGYSDIQLRGYREGMDGARKDWGNHRSPNPNNRDEYKHPHDVPHSLDHDYRAAFRAGYRRAWHHLQEGGMDRDHDHRD